MRYPGYDAATPWIARLAGLFLVLCLAVAAGCESDDDDDVDHTPPANMGSLVIENNTDNHMAVYIAGVQREDAREDRSTVYDLEPGDYRVWLDEQGGDRQGGTTVDILEGRLTILNVIADVDDDDGYEMSLRLD